MILGYESLNVKTETVFNGLQAVNAIKESFHQNDPFALILMDCNMPFMDGYEATKKIRKMYSDRNIPKNN
jgi:CheY-like chemotaxis protein